MDISEGDENILERKEVLKMANEHHYIIRNNIHVGRHLEGPLEGKLTRGRLRTEWMTNIKEWTGIRYEDLLRLAQYREQWKIKTNFLKKMPFDDDEAFQVCSGNW